MTQSGGVFSPGVGPDDADVGDFVVSGGGKFRFDISDASGVSGDVDGWDTAFVEPNGFTPSSATIDLPCRRLVRRSIHGSTSSASSPRGSRLAPTPRTTSTRR